MKTIKSAFTFLATLSIFACEFNTSKVSERKSHQSTLTAQEQVDLEIQKQSRAEATLDSLRLDTILQDALYIATQNIDKKRFKKSYEVLLANADSTIVDVNLDLDYHFSTQVSHLIIHRNGPYAVFIDIYSTGDQYFKKVISHERWILTYENDTIRDINGDGRNDFVVNWYGAAGCCLKGFSEVYLLKSDQHTFSKGFEFINPTFSPKEHIVRGVCYGHPGETELYKYQWNGEQIDTLEYVYYEKNKKGKTGKIIIANHPPHKENTKILKRLNKIPIEYKKIYGYDWFTGDI